MTEPTIVELPDRPYVAIPGTVTMQTIGKIADRFPEMFGWLAGKGVAPAGSPFLRYKVIDMEGELELEAGIPVAEAVPGEGDIIAGTLPGGRFATVSHHGHVDGLADVTGALLAWADERGLAWDREGRRWGCRMEVYNTNPAEVSDMNEWDTDIQIRLA
ncbi:GyrI-like domain-containing protein [Actinophytocola sp.]|uniref:GyrI-like domain-containing protein n=1 Tax=Actinophytocola sp. TaxID=1872138 RepID=UPI002D80E385|nr:GyrI-like domain-containing protein [Actinophytocola sp.]HET9140698.1 GyrI-like domain-containing protein [Actinophytocola sp.]